MNNQQREQARHIAFAAAHITVCLFNTYEVSNNHESFPHSASTEDVWPVVVAPANNLFTAGLFIEMTPQDGFISLMAVDPDTGLSSFRTVAVTETGLLNARGLCDEIYNETCTLIRGNH